MADTQYKVQAQAYLDTSWYYDVIIAPQKDREEFFSYIKDEEKVKEDD